MRRAFTMIEMLTVSALAAVLFAALLTVTASLGRSNAAISRHEQANRWPHFLTETIRWDLAQARSLNSRSDMVTMTTHASLDPTTLQPLHRPAEVTYSIRTISNRRWLVRTQNMMTRDGSPESWTALISPDIRSFTLNAAGPVTRPTTRPLQQNVPRAIELKIRSVNSRIADLQQTLLLR